MTKRWKYIGDKKNISECQFKDNLVKIIGNRNACIDGSCPGHISGICMFYDGDPMPKYQHLFEKISPKR